MTSTMPCIMLKYISLISHISIHNYKYLRSYKMFCVWTFYRQVYPLKILLKTYLVKAFGRHSKKKKLCGMYDK